MLVCVTACMQACMASHLTSAHPVKTPLLQHRGTGTVVAGHILLLTRCFAFLPILFSPFLWLEQMRLVKLQRRRLARQRVAKEAEIEKVKNQLREMGRSLETGPAHSTPASAPTCVGARGAAGSGGGGTGGRGGAGQVRTADAWLLVFVCVWQWEDKRHICPLSLWRWVTWWI